MENRDWWRESIVGHHIAIHAGRRYCRDGAEFIDELSEGAGHAWRVPSRDESREGIVGVVRVCGVTDGTRVIAGTYPAEGFVWREWFVGQFGWLMEDVTQIEPVPCKGAQGLWVVPPNAADEVRRRWSAARSSRGSTRGSEAAPDHAAPDSTMISTAGERARTVDIQLGKHTTKTGEGETRLFPGDSTSGEGPTDD